MGNTKIDWAKKVWNPTTGCTKVSQGCRNCYAERMANRFWKDRKFTDVQCHPDRLEEPLHWLKPQRVFVDSMSDLFHPDVSDGFIARVYARIIEANWHTFLILTKRPERMHQFFGGAVNIPNNLWFGVSIEDQATADRRIPYLLKIPSALRFISYEPALGPVQFRLYDSVIEKGEQFYKADMLKWLIMGSESGPGARPMDIDWARSVRDQCQSASVPFFFKQMQIDGVLTHMPELDGKVWDQIPEVK